ncbi:hypothetical protein [Chitinibacter sp. S2-10]|uniref:hypothetical protein n=1 Tax=Chitinibacter sp. S2-10 TaxID=3373597 RepID=UPI0039773B1B
MSEISYFLAVISLSLCCSLLAILWLQRAIGPLLRENCPGSGAHYWQHTLSALQLLIPLLLVLVFASRLDYGLVESLRKTMIWLLFGHLAAIAIIAKIVWRRLVPQPDTEKEIT